MSRIIFAGSDNAVTLAIKDRSFTNPEEVYSGDLTRTWCEKFHRAADCFSDFAISQPPLHITNFVWVFQQCIVFLILLSSFALWNIQVQYEHVHMSLACLKFLSQGPLRYLCFYFMSVSVNWSPTFKSTRLCYCCHPTCPVQIHKCPYCLLV